VTGAVQQFGTSGTFAFGLLFLSPWVTAYF